ncbi:MAG: HD domain-containing protein, partial [Chloroflexi bacterium]|nr:HD domain-containing protein [Chloroflexota bacterium]
IVLKDSALRSQASRLAAETAVTFLRAQQYPPQYLEAIAHAIAAHSFSAGIAPQTIEAKVVQDADRLDALGAVGMARTFMVGGALQRPLYHPSDPFCAARPADDAISTLDHFYTKLFKLAGTMQTAAGRQEAQRRTAFMQAFLTQLAGEIGAQDQPA